MIAAKAAPTFTVVHIKTSISLRVLCASVAKFLSFQHARFGKDITIMLYYYRAFADSAFNEM
jgi:hypothetical protein